VQYYRTGGKKQGSRLNLLNFRRAVRNCDDFEDWGAGWKQHFRPFHVAPLLVIKPSWEPYEPQAGEAVIEIGVTPLSRLGRGE